MHNRVVAFPDTNIFLHFKPFKEIPWTKELGCASVCLRITKVVIGELNKHKDTNSREHLRERAQKAVSTIRKVVFTNDGAINDCVSVICETAASRVDMAARALDPNSADDCILAEILEYREAHPEERVILVTDDPGFALRAHSYGVTPAELSAKFKIPAHDDPKHKIIRELKQRIRDVEKGLPRLSLAYSGGSDSKVVIMLHPEIEPTIEAARAYVAENIAPLFPLHDPTRWRRLASEQDAEKPPEAVAVITQFVGSISEVVAAKGNADLATYFEQFAQYLLAFWKHGADMGRTAQLLLRIENSGGAPAEDVNIALRFPKSLTIFPDGGLPDPPQQPPPPRQTPTKRVNQPAVAPPRPKGSIRYVRPIDTGSHFELRYHVEKLNHHLDEQFSGLYIRFPSYMSAASFTIEYRIAALNAPDPVMGSLHVVIEKPQTLKPKNCSA